MREHKYNRIEMIRNIKVLDKFTEEIGKTLLKHGFIATKDIKRAKKQGYYDSQG